MASDEETGHVADIVAIHGPCTKSKHPSLNQPAAYLAVRAEHQVKIFSRDAVIACVGC